jgi:hypothetical protein
MILALSSTAIVLSTLQEKGLMNTPPGQSIFSVLLIQDLAVIPILAILPLLATQTMQAESHHGPALFDITALPGYLRLIVVLLSIVFIYGLGKYGAETLPAAQDWGQCRGSPGGLRVHGSWCHHHSPRNLRHGTHIKASRIPGNCHKAVF